MIRFLRKIQVIAGAILLSSLASGYSVHAADFSDTFLGYKYGSRFADPYIQKDISKNVLNFGHVSAYKYGSNVISIDYLISDKNDPAHDPSKNALNASVTGATEVYAIYRHTLDFGKISGSKFKFGPIAGIGFTAGFDVNTKHDAGYNSKKQMIVAGPTFFLGVPAGFVNVSVLQLWESNAPFSTLCSRGVSRFSYDPHPMLDVVWGIPVGTFFLKGFGSFITPKGLSEPNACFGTQSKTAPETQIDISLMYDMASVLGTPKNALQVGVGYNYWRNKFGNDASIVPGVFARTPNLKFEYHF
jgi:hypothetical protein